VPETPTSGLDKEGLFGAIRVINKLPGTQRTILLAGPTFSGSAVSLKESAQELAMQSRSRVQCIQASSGTVSNAAPWEFSDHGCQSKFEMIQTPDDDALSAFADGMKSLFYQKNQIAILSEEGTKYGRQQNDKPTSKNNDDTKSKNKEIRNSGEFLLLHFPRGISNLRNASDPVRAASSTNGGNYPTPSDPLARLPSAR
jgi:hypothetical protein